MLHIDGSIGEGGGQVLRTSLALAIITGTPVTVSNIRAGREKPGLLRQHLCAVRAAAAICGGTLDGDEMASRQIQFTPGQVRPDTYTFAVGTAGSAALVLQTVLPPLLLATGPSRLKLDGGTHAKSAPPFPFIEQVFLPMLRRMGADVRAELVRWGFYPAGGGRMIVDIAPKPLKRLELPSRGAVVAMDIVGAVSALDTRIARRETVEICKGLGRPLGEARTIDVPDPQGPGNVAWVQIDTDHSTELFTAFGERRLRAEEVARQVVHEVRDWLAADVPVGEYLADQLLLPMALAGGGMFRTTRPSLHLTTNIEVIRRFLDIPIAVMPEAGAYTVTVG